MLRDKIYQRKQLENDKKYKLATIDLLRTKIATSQLKGISVQGNCPKDKMFEIILKIENIEKDIVFIDMQLDILIPAIKEDLELFNNYNPIDKKIVELREIEGYRWEKIAEEVGYSERQCRRRFKKCINTK